MLEEKSYEEFAALVNAKFQLAETSPASELVLTEITERKLTARQDIFSLIFLGANEFPLSQGTYLLKHEKHGEGMLFLVPIEQNETGIKYEAAFNRLINNE